MDENFPDHHRQLIVTDNLYHTPVQLHSSSGQAGPPRLPGALRHPFFDCTNSERPSHGCMSQLRPEDATNAIKAAADDSPWAKPSKPGGRRRRGGDHNPVTGLALQDRRRQAQDRITQGGWKANIAKTAIEYLPKTVWYDTPSKVWGIQRFIRDAEDLGELCSDWKAIRQFLDKNIHKFIAFHALEKDFKVPDYMIRRANQEITVGCLRYPWLQSFIQEYQGQGRTTAESLVEVYKVQGDGLIPEASLASPARVHQGGSSGGATAAAPGTRAKNLALSREAEGPSSQTCEMTLGEGTHRRKRQRTFDVSEDVDIGDLIKKVKREPTEGGFVERRVRTQEPDICEVGINDADDGKERMHAKGRNLTVLFHGMMHGENDESEHVQVYVPRTSKGMTINFL